MRTTIF